MKTVVFNIHDAALLLLGIECCLLAILLFMRRGITIRRLLFAFFLIMNGLIALDNLIFWGDAFRYRVFDLAPGMFFLFGVAVFIEGPVLYWYTKSSMYKNFMFRPVDALHLLPAAVTPFYLYFIYYRHPVHIQRGLALDLEVYSVPDGYFNLYVDAQKFILVVYGVMCLSQLLRYRVMLKNGHSNIERMDLTWLYLLIGGFLSAWAWNLATHLVGLHAPGNFSDIMGISGNYLNLVLVNILLFYGLLHPEILASFGFERRRGGGEQVNPEEIIGRIRSVMEAERLFLNPRLTREDFSAHVNLPPRLVTSVINQHLHQNFQEFVNRYRVEEARRILGEPAYRERSILDVATMAGFNSKDTFNRLFSKLTGLTPSEYRQKHLY